MRQRGPVPRKASNWLHARARDIRRGQNVRATMLAALLSLGALALLTLWLTGALGPAASSLAGARDRALLTAGFGVGHIEIVGEKGVVLTGPGARAVRRALAVEEGELIFSVNLADARHRVEGLGWIARARIVRQLPNRLMVIVQARKPFALWQSGGKWHVIGANGDVIVSASAADQAALPLAVAAGAPQKLQNFLAQMRQYPAIAQKVRAYVRVGKRRWNLHLLSGADLMLPAERPGQVLSLIAKDAKLMALLDMKVQRIDARLPGRLFVRGQGLSRRGKSGAREPVS